MDYPELIAEVTERTGISGVATRAAMHTGMAEADLNKRLRVGPMEASATVTTDSERKAVLPTDFLALRAALYAGRSLPGLHLDEILSGAAHGFAVEGNSLYSSYADAPITLHYYAALPAVSVAGTNWLLQAEPEIYLYAVMRQAYLAALDAEKAQAASTVLDGLVAAFVRSDISRRFQKTPYRTCGPTP